MVALCIAIFYFLFGTCWLWLLLLLFLATDALRFRDFRMFLFLFIVLSFYRPPLSPPLFIYLSISLTILSASFIVSASPFLRDSASLYLLKSPSRHSSLHIAQRVYHLFTSDHSTIQSHANYHISSRLLRIRCYRIRQSATGWISLRFQCSLWNSSLRCYIYRSSEFTLFHASWKLVKFFVAWIFITKKQTNIVPMNENYSFNKNNSHDMNSNSRKLFLP